MTIKASGPAALILATGIWVCVGGWSQAATDTSTAATTTAKHHHLKKYAHRKSAKMADQSSTDKKVTEASVDDSDNSAAIQSSRMPASVANANAELVAPGTPAGNAQAMTDRANNIVQAANPADTTAAAPVVAADQLNDVDRALQEGTPAAAPVALASADAPAATAPPPAAAASASSESSTWDRTSLIGKIFIGFGALLTMASAARMFMA
ncbi:MAG TPA: hypothetical protein VGM09_31610 [Bradyrhizobium sp.]|jgi:hypothetical protein